MEQIFANCNFFVRKKRLESFNKYFMEKKGWEKRLQERFKTYLSRYGGENLDLVGSMRLYWLYTYTFEVGFNLRPLRFF